MPSTASTSRACSSAGASPRLPADLTERTLPDGLVEGRRTPTFDESSIPAALRSAHHTTVWAELVVEAGEVVFVVDETGEETAVAAGSRHVIVPHERHAVRLGTGARFHVQFWAESTGDHRACRSDR